MERSIERANKAVSFQGETAFLFYIDYSPSRFFLKAQAYEVLADRV